MNLKQQIAEILKASNYYGIPGDTLAESISKLESLIESEAVEFVEWMTTMKVERVGKGIGWEVYALAENGICPILSTAELYKLKSKQK